MQSVSGRGFWRKGSNVVDVVDVVFKMMNIAVIVVFVVVVVRIVIVIAVGIEIWIVVVVVVEAVVNIGMGRVTAVLYNIFIIREKNGE